MPSPFLYNDWKKHFSINLDTGLWQDFKSGKAGNFVSLYAFLEGITYHKAESTILLKTFLNDTMPSAPKEPPTAQVEEIKLEPLSINSCYSEDEKIKDAWCLLYERNLFDLEDENPQYFFCREGRFANRIIIPYINKDTMYFFQARALYPDMEPKYLNPPSHVYIKKSDVLYPFDYDEDYVVICEGPLDAISLNLQGVNATCTMGCRVSDSQIDQLAEFHGKVILGYDSDSAGRRGVEDFDRLRKHKRMSTPYFCPIPMEHKDWNEAHVSDFNLSEWIREQSKPLNFENKILDSLFS